MEVIKFKQAFLLVSLIIFPAISMLGQENKSIAPTQKNEILGQQNKQLPSTKKGRGASADAKEKKKEKEDTLDKDIREHAYAYLSNILTGSDTLDDKIQAAHLRANYAELICAYGDRNRAIEVFRQSISEIVRQLIEQEIREEKQISDASKDEKRKIYDDEAIFELALQLAQTAIKCDPSAKTAITTELEGIKFSSKERDGISRKEKESDITRQNDLSTVPDEAWGTQPSIKRRMAAQFLTTEAHAKIAEGKLTEAMALLRESSLYCVSVPFVTAIGRLFTSKPAEASLMFIQAAQRVQSTPSGAEVRALNFGLRPLGANPLTIKPGSNPQSDALIKSYLMAISSLVQSPDNVRVSRSADTLRIVKESLPLYIAFHPEAFALIENWVRESTNGFSSSVRRSVIEKREFGAESAEERISRYEKIALQSEDSSQRDQACASLASNGIQYGNFDKATEWANKILDTALRQEMLDAVTVRQISFKLTKITEDKYQSMKQSISGIFSPTLRAQLYIQLAKTIAKCETKNNEVKNGLEVSYQALQESSLIADSLKSSATQSHLLFSIAGAYAEFDTIRALAGVREAAQSIGRHKDQPPSRLGGKIIDVTTVQFDSTGFFSRKVFDDRGEYKKPYDFSIFRKLAQENFDLSWLAATQIDDNLLQLVAKYEVCAAILLNPKYGKAEPQQVSNGKSNEEKK